MFAVGINGNIEYSATKVSTGIVFSKLFNN